MNWLIIIIVCILAIGLMVFLVMRNQKDEKKFEEKLDNDYPKPKNENGNIEINELKDTMH